MYFCMRNILLRDSYSCPVFFSHPLLCHLLLLIFELYFLYFPSLFPLFLFLCVGLAVRADINECEPVPVPCAYQCDGKSYAGLERLPSYESFSYGYRTSQSSSDRSSYQQRYHSLTSQSFYSYVPIGGRHMANRLNNATPHTRRDTNTCRPGFQANNGQCLGNFKSNC